MGMLIFVDRERYNQYARTAMHPGFIFMMGDPEKHPEFSRAALECYTGMKEEFGNQYLITFYAKPDLDWCIKNVETFKSFFKHNRDVLGELKYTSDLDIADFEYRLFQKLGNYHHYERFYAADFGLPLENGEPVLVFSDAIPLSEKVLRKLYVKKLNPKNSYEYYFNEIKEFQSLVSKGIRSVDCSFVKKDIHLGFKINNNVINYDNSWHSTSEEVFIKIFEGIHDKISDSLKKQIVENINKNILGITNEIDKKCSVYKNIIYGNNSFVIENLFFEKEHKISFPPQQRALYLFFIKHKQISSEEIFGDSSRKYYNDYAFIYRTITGNETEMTYESFKKAVSGIKQVFINIFIGEIAEKYCVSSEHYKYQLGLPDEYIKITGERAKNYIAKKI